MRKWARKYLHGVMNKILTHFTSNEAGTTEQNV
jgi:hypothetical protein